MTSDDDRIAYLAGDGPGALDDLDQAELDELKMLLADPSLWVEPDASLENAVVAAIEGEAVGATAPAPAPVPTPPPSPTTSRAERRAQRRWFRPVATGVGVLAAAAAVVIGVIVVTADEVDNPDQFAIALPAPNPGTLDFEKFDGGWRIQLDVAGLPRLDNGRFYQAWLRNADGVLVAVGSFNEGEDVVLWAGVSPRDFDTFTITREAADGDQASSGDRVLAVPIVEG